MPLRISGHALPLSVSAGLLLGACAAESRFVRSDPAFVAKPRATAPELYARAVTPPSHRAVGIIEITMQENTPPEQVQAAARKSGQQLGCDVVVEQAQAKLSRAELAELPVLELAHDFDPERAEAEPSSPQKTYRFVCGMLSLPLHPA